MSVAARALETPKSCSTSRRVSRSRSRASSWRMASGMASSQRGVAGIGERRVGYNPCGECELGRCTARMLCSRLVDDRLLVKIRSGGGWGGVEGPIKRVMGRCAQATGPSAGTGGRRAHTGRPEPVARAPVAAAPDARVLPGGWQIEGLPACGPARRTAGRGADGGVCHRPDPQPADARGIRRGRDAILHLVRRARARARTDFTDRRGHLHRRDATRVSRPHDHAAAGRPSAACSIGW